MSTDRRRQRTHQRLLAAQRDPRPPTGHDRDGAVDATPEGRDARGEGRAVRDAATSSAGREDGGGTPGPAPAPDPRSEATSEGLELVDVLGSGRGTRTWLGRERTSLERFEVTLPTSTDAQERSVHLGGYAALVAAWSGVSHPHLLPVRAVLGEDEHPRGLVTDHVPARSLAARIREDGRPSPQELLPVLAAVADGLAALHERGWVHGTLDAHRVLLGDGDRVLLDGYGLPVTRDDSSPAPSWGLDERPDRLERGTARTPADDVHALAVMGWTALTGRHPGPTSHRVPLTLVCPTAPRPLVLMLEAALAEETSERPTAAEFAAGLSAGKVRSRPAVAPVPVPGDVIRADGSRVKPLRRVRLAAALHNSAAGSGRGGRAHGSLRGGPRRRVRSGDGATAVATPRAHRGVLILAALAFAAAVTAGTLWSGVLGGDAVPGRTAAGEHDTAEQSAAPVDPSRSGGPAAGNREAPATTPLPPGTGTAHSGDVDRPGPGASPGATGAAGAEASDTEPARAVRELVALRASALADGDPQALTTVYAPDTDLAAKDRAVLARATAAGHGAAPGETFHGLEMTVERLVPMTTPADSSKGASRIGAARSFYAEVVTTGWDGQVPRAAHVRRTGRGVLQSLSVTVVRTPHGWRLADVTPVAERTP